MNGARPRIVLLAGPTAAGKTALGVRLAEVFKGEVLAADSRQVYRGMDVATGKPTPEERARVPHHLIDLVEPDAAFHAAAYRALAHAGIEEVAGRGALPIVVGGTGLYLRALTRGLCPAPPASLEVRSALQATLALEGSAALHRRLAERDPEGAGRIRPSDPVRIVRALEVLEVAGVPLWRFQEEHRFSESPFETLWIGLEPGADELDARIRRRVDAMIAGGLLEETQGLLSRGFPPTLPSLSGIGYREAIEVLRGRSSLEGLGEAMVRRTRAYAKRQRTWFRSEPIRWFHPDRGQGAIREAVEAFREGAA